MKSVVVANGNSRNRVKACWRLKGTLKGEEEWYRGNGLFNVFVSLKKQRDESVFLLIKVNVKVWKEFSK